MEISDLAIAKVEKVNIAVKYNSWTGQLTGLIYHPSPKKFYCTGL
jgi:hypothetical protein